MSPVGKRKKGTTNKKRTGRQTARKGVPQKRGIPYIAIYLALLLIGFICYFVFAAPTPKPVVRQKSSLKEEVLPDMPEARWEYEKTLPLKQIEVEIPEKIKSTKRYQMQCGSFKHQKDAEKLKAQIAFQGLKSQVRHTGNWFRVVLGPYERRRLAEKDNHKLKRSSINGCQIWGWN